MCAFTFAAILLILSGYVLNYVIHFPIIDRQELLKKLSPDKLYLPWLLAFGPQKKQHLIFISLSLLCPGYCLLALALTEKLWYTLKTYMSNYRLLHLINRLIITIGVTFFSLICYISLATPFTITGLHLSHPNTMAHYPFLHKILNHKISFTLFTTLLAFAFAVACLYLIDNYFKKIQHYKKNIAQPIKIGLIIISIISITISSFPGHLLTFNFLTYYHNGVTDLDAVFYGLTQIMHGKTLLSNMPSQYGMFPEILYPLFKLIGLSTFKFSLVMCILEYLALFALLLTIYLLTNNILITTLYAIFLGLICGGIYTLLGSHGVLELSPYYQYWPIRFIFPATSILIFWWFAKKITYKKTALISLFVSLATIWNLESGISIFGATLFYMCALSIYAGTRTETSQKYILRNIFLLICTITIALIIFALYMEIKSGFLINWMDIFKYQHIFYNLGVAQLPMTKELDMWCVILATYLFGIIYSFFKWTNNRDSNDILTPCILYISTLGIGLFTYYEYRAHPLNLINVSWSSILLWCIFANEIFIKIKQQKLPTIFALFGFPVIFLCLFSTTIYIYLLPILYKRGTALLITTPAPNSELAKNTLFIKNELPDSDRKAVILLPGQSIFSAELTIASEIDGPGEMETLLKIDYDSAINQLLTKSVKNIFIKHGDKRLLSLQPKYHAVKTSSTGIIHLSPGTLYSPNQ